MKKTFKVFLVLADFLLTSYISLYAIAYLIPPLELNNINGIYYYDSDGNLFTGTTKEWINIDNISKKDIYIILYRTADIVNKNNGSKSETLSRKIILHID